MDQMTINLDEERLNRVAAAFQDGIILLDSSGAIVSMDRTARRRVNGELRDLALPTAASETDSVGCVIFPVDLTVDGERLTVAVIQETEAPKPGPDLIAAIEGVLADSTSWFTRTVMEKLRTVGQVKTGPTANGAGNGTAQLDALSARERDVLGLICEGQSDAQMAKMLGLSENTVRNHIAALYRKIGVNRRTAAVIWARERGVIGREGLGPSRRSGKSAGRALPY